MSSKKRLALLASGGGTTVEAILKACRESQLPYIEPAVLITDRPGAGVVERTGWSGIPHRLVERRRFHHAEFGNALLRVLEDFAIDIVGQYGWLSLTPHNVIAAFDHGKRIINQHPGPVPWFGVKGMWGKRPHAAVLKFCELLAQRRGEDLRYTLVISQWVDPLYDQGRVLLWKHVNIYGGSTPDTPETLQARALPVEHETQIETLRLLSTGPASESIFYYTCPFVREGEEDLAKEACQYALTTEP